MFDRVPARGPSWCLRSGMAGLPASSEGEGSSSCAVSTDSSDAPNVQSLISVLKAPKHSDLSRSRRVAVNPKRPKRSSEASIMLQYNKE